MRTLASKNKYGMQPVFCGDISLPGELGNACIDHGAADAHLLAQLPLRRQLGTHGKVTGEDHILQLLDKKLL